MLDLIIKKIYFLEIFNKLQNLIENEDFNKIIHILQKNIFKVYEETKINKIVEDKINIILEELELEKNDDYEKQKKVIIKIYTYIQLLLIYLLEKENLNFEKLEIGLQLVDEAQIKEINNSLRNIDNVTDVLSFPMMTEDEIISLQQNMENLEYADTFGDIVICFGKIIKQAEEYNHSQIRELSYLIVHSFYHLMGYDHMNDNDKKIMRAKEEEALNNLMILR